HKRAQESGLPPPKRPRAAVAELLHVMEILKHVGIGLKRRRVLFFQDASRIAGKPGEEKQKIVFEVVQGFAGKGERLRVDTLVGIKGEAGDSAIRGNVLVLFSDGILEPVYLDLTGESRQLVRVDHRSPVDVERFQ